MSVLARSRSWRTWLGDAVELARRHGLEHQVRATYFAAIARGEGPRRAAATAVLEWIVPEQPELMEEPGERGGA